MTTTKQLLKRIARTHLQVPTLEPRNSDSLDFHTVSVWSITDALNAAFAAGADSVRNDGTTIDIHQLLEGKARRRWASFGAPKMCRMSDPTWTMTKPGRCCNDAARFTIAQLRFHLGFDPVFRRRLVSFSR